MSLTTLDPHLAAKIEPRASSPADRLHTIKELNQAGVPVVVMVAPIIPAINDREIPRLLEAAAEAGAIGAHWVLLRLPYQIKALFKDWLVKHFPDRAKHVQTLIRDTQGGELYDSTYGVRMRGTGAFASHIAGMFKVYAR